MTRRHGILRKVVFLLSSGASLALLLWGVVFYLIQTGSATRQFDSQLDQSFARVSTNVATPQWNYDSNGVKTIVDLEFQSPITYAILVMDKDNKLEYGAIRGDSGRIKPYSQDNMETLLHGPTLEMREGDISYNDVAIGHLRAYYSRKSLGDQIASITKMIVAQVSTLLVLLFALSYFLIRQIILRNLFLVSAQMKEISRGEGDLTKKLEIHTRDEFGELAVDFNSLTSNLSKMMRQIRLAASRLSSVGAELSRDMGTTSASLGFMTGSIREINQTIEKQSHNTLETSSTVEEISASIAGLNRLIGSQSSAVLESSASIQEMVANMRAVGATIDKVSEKFRALAKVSDEGISRMREANEWSTSISGQSETLMEANQMIAGFAAQTNLLSMNASIEAAHAGEFGKGFAVVADEIRKLAELAGRQSGDAGKSLKVLKEAIESVVNATTQASEAFEKILASIGEVSGLVEEVKGAMNEESAGSTQILQALAQITDITQTVHASAGEMESGTRLILSNMEHLKDEAEEVRTGMQEIAKATEEINSSVQRVKERSAENETGIKSVVSEIERFKIEK